MKRILYFVLAAAMLAMIGCTGDTNTNAVTNPNATALSPTGTIQGRLIDACTQMPIQGAIIDIGVAKTVTASTGQYVLKKVPATAQASNSSHGLGADSSSSSSYGGTYSATIDLRNAINPVTGKKFAANTYPAFAYNEMSVSFTTLNGSGNNTQNKSDTSNGNNPAVPVINLVSGDQDIVVGQLDGKIQGSVELPTQLPAANMYVQLIATRFHNSDNPGKDDGGTGSTNSSTGLEDNLVAAVARTDANGNYSFSGVEAQRVYKVLVTDTDPQGSTPPALDNLHQRHPYVSTQCSGLTAFNDLIILDKESAQSPCLLSVTPANFANVGVSSLGTDSVAVAFAFNKAITGDNLNGIPASSSAADIAAANNALTSAGNPNDIFPNVIATFNGFKATKVPFTLSWSTDLKTLTVTIPNVAPAAIYSVDISNALSVIGASTDCSGSANTTFYTFGASTAAQPVVSAINTPYDFDSSIVLSWLASSQAKKYNVYCQAVENWGTTQEVGPWALVSGNLSAGSQSITPTALTNAFPNLTYTFIENTLVKMTYNCKVRGVNADGTENTTDTGSNVVSGIADAVPPKAVCYTTAGTTLNVCFSEPVDKNSAQTAANYTFGNFSTSYTVPKLTNPGVFSGTELNTSPVTTKYFCVTYTLDKSIDFTQIRNTANPFLTILGVPDIAGNAISTAGTPPANTLNNLNNVCPTLH